MDAAQQLLEIEAIKQLKARYFRLLDTKDFAGWTEVFAPHFDHFMEMEQQEINGPREEFVAFVAERLAGMTTVHHGTMPEIELLSDTKAKGIWAFVDHITPANGPKEDGMVLQGFGHYHETYEKIDGVWRIATQRVTRLRLDITMPEPQ
jgi:ketosteroid isomerase-like protein